MWWFFQLIVTAVLGLAIGYILGNTSGQVQAQQQARSIASPADELLTKISHSSLTQSSATDTESAAHDQPTILPPPGSTALSKPGAHRRVIIVAKQLPITLRKVDGKWTFQWNDPRSFLANLRVLREKIEVVWVGWVGQHIPKAEQEEVEDLLMAENLTPVFLPPDLADRCFNGFCRGVLWPLFHYTLPSAVIDFATSFDDTWQAYTAANTLYATVVSHTVESSSDWVWVHNYHLLLVPGFVRNKLPRARIGLFLHTPFPSSDVFRLLPTRSNLLTAIMAADLIGFHTFDYARHFLSALKRVMDLDFESLPGGRLGIKYSGRFVSIIINHVGIDANFFRTQATSIEVQELVQQIKAKYHPRKIIVGVDDLDLVKGSLLKMQAYERFLDRYPTMKDKVVMVEVVGASGGSPSEQNLVRNALYGEFDQIKKKFGNDVLDVLDGSDVSLARLVALYAASDCAVVSTFWDGLNLVPFEFTAAQSIDNPGSLIVSEFMGCSRSLNGVSRVNPWSIDSVAETIHHTMVMSQDERKANHSRRFTYVMNHNIERWSLGFLDALELASKQGASLSYVQVGWGSNVRLLGVRSDFMHLDEGQIAMAYRKCTKRILLLDYDGTLNSPDKSAQRSKLVGPTPAVMHILKLLTDDRDNYVFIMSGRTRDCLHEWFSSLPELGIAAEKGCFLKWPARVQHTRKHAKLQAQHKQLAPSHSPRMGDGRTLGTISEDESDRLPQAVRQHQRQRSGSHSSRSQYGSKGKLTDLEQKDPTASTTRLTNSSARISQSHISSSSESDEDEDWQQSSSAQSSDSENELDDSEWESLVPLDDIGWKSVALDLIKSYTESVDGSWIEDKEFAIVWHYEQADPEYGRMQASELHKYLIKVINNPAVDVLKYDYNRILEVKPKGINKGVAAAVIMEMLVSNNPKHGSTATTPLPVSQTTPTSIVNRSPAMSPTQPISPSGMMSPTLNPQAAPAENEEPFILAIGDDRSDEDMFSAVQNRDNYGSSKKRDAAAHAARSSYHQRHRGGKQGSGSHHHQVHFADGEGNTPGGGDEIQSPPIPTTTLNLDETTIGQPPPANTSPNRGPSKFIRSQSEPQYNSDGSTRGSSSDLSSDGSSSTVGQTLGKKQPSHPFTFTVCVGMKPSKAHYYLHDDEEVIKMLAALANCSRRAQMNKMSDSRFDLDSQVQARNPAQLPTLQLPSLTAFRNSRNFSLTNMVKNMSGKGLANMVNEDDSPDSR